MSIVPAVGLCFSKGAAALPTLLPARAKMLVALGLCRTTDKESTRQTRKSGPMFRYKSFMCRAFVRIGFGGHSLASCGACIADTDLDQ